MHACMHACMRACLCWSEKLKCLWQVQCLEKTAWETQHSAWATWLWKQIAWWCCQLSLCLLHHCTLSLLVEDWTLFASRVGSSMQQECPGWKTQRWHKVTWRCLWEFCGKAKFCSKTQNFGSIGFCWWIVQAQKSTATLMHSCRIKLHIFWRRLKQHAVTTFSKCLLK